MSLVSAIITTRNRKDLLKKAIQSVLTQTYEEIECIVVVDASEEQSTEAKSLLKKKLQYYSSEIQRDVGNLVKWLMIAVLVGCITGAASTLFSFVLKSVTNCRKENEWMFYLLPVMGLIIVIKVIISKATTNTPNMPNKCNRS
jgi:glycosyltransferase involved in cell wall biosynthesis